MKTCKTCNLSKSIDSFYSKGNECRMCTIERSTRNYQANRVNYRDGKRQYYHRKGRDHLREREYGVSKERYTSMLEWQNNECAICHKKEKLVVDHNHTTGEVRGLLCQRCNLAISYFHDDPERIRRAIVYLNGSN